jgi:hypothetical protein
MIVETPHGFARGVFSLAGFFNVNKVDRRDNTCSSTSPTTRRRTA